MKLPFPSRSVEDLLSEKARTFETILGDLSASVKSRRELSQRILTDTEQSHRQVREELLLLDTLRREAAPLDSHRQELEKRMEKLAHERRQEQLSCWRDVMGLKREFRDWFKQLMDLQMRSRLVHPSMPITGYSPRQLNYPGTVTDWDTGPTADESESLSRR